MAPRSRAHSYDAVAAGDHDAVGGEVDAWINALIAPVRSRTEVAAARAAAEQRYLQLRDPDQARRLHAAIDFASRARLGQR